MNYEFLKQKTSKGFRKIKVQDQQIAKDALGNLACVDIVDYDNEQYWVLNDPVQGELLIGYTDGGNFYTRP